MCPPAKLSHFQEPSEEELTLFKPAVPLIEAAWTAHCIRKQVKFFRRQLQRTHSYFSYEEVLETLSNAPWKAQASSGQCTYASGAIYNGAWLGGFRHGQGHILYPDGAQYYGQWAYSRPCGQGRFIHIDGDTYDGHWGQYQIVPSDASSKNCMTNGYCTL